MADKERKFELELDAVQSMQLKPRQKRDAHAEAKFSGQPQPLPLKPGATFSREVIERLIAWFKEN